MTQHTPKSPKLTTLTQILLYTSLGTLAQHTHAQNTPSPNTESKPTQKLTNPQQINQILDVLHLKKDIEQGKIDQTAIETYQKNLNTPKSTTPTTPNTPEQPADGYLQQQIAQIQQKQYQMASPSTLEAQIAQIQNELQQNTDFDQPIATLNDKNPIIGLNADQTESFNQALKNNTNNNNANNIDNKTNNTSSTNDNTPQGILDPNQYLPKYQKTDNITEIKTTENNTQNDKQNNTQDNAQNPNKNPDQTDKKPNFIKRLYTRLFNDGYNAQTHIKTTIYQTTNPNTNQTNAPQLKAVDLEQQPYKNIKATLDQFTTNALTDFQSVLPLLRQEALNAAKAVGYYDIKLKFEQPSKDTLKITVEQLGDPIIVKNRTLEIRGQGSQMPDYQHLEQALPPKVGDIFNQGEYSNSKFVINTLSDRLGFFDAKWLNQSADIILPDNIADIDLIYETGNRYQFDKITFITIDPETGKLTQDINKMPIKPELLKQLLQFKAGDPFYRPLITQLSNDLASTRYFNAINIEAITPPIDGNGQLNFDNTTESNTNTDNDNKNNDQNNQDNNNTQSNNPNNPDNLNNNNTKNKDITNNTNQTQIQPDQTPSDNTQTPLENSDLTPINFQIDESTADKLLAIKQKAERLNALPDDRVLDEQKIQTRSLLGKISDGISKIAQAILPNETSNDLPERIEADESITAQKTPEQVQDDKKVPLYVFMLADKPKDAQIGFGYGTDTGARLTARLDNNLINKDGYQAGIEASGSRANKSLSAYISRPYRHPLNDTLNARLTYEEEDLDQGTGNFDLSTKTIEARLARNIKKQDGWNRRLSLRYRLDELDTGLSNTQIANLPINFTSASLKQQALLLGYNLSKTQLDNPTNPTQGSKQYYSLEIGSKNTGSDANMAILKAGWAGIHSFGKWNKHQVIGKLDTGYIWTNNFYDVPYKLRFFAGGDQSIRGYDYQSLSPLSDNGYLEGGQALAIASGEYNYEFKPGLRGAIFTDIGNAYDKDFKNQTKIGTGVGIRWTSPVGIVRVDVAAGIKEEGVPIRLYFFIGAPF